MDDRIIVFVTGANTGLGLEMVKALYSSENAYEVLLGGRSLTKAREAAEATTKQFLAANNKIWPI